MRTRSFLMRARRAGNGKKTRRVGKEKEVIMERSLPIRLMRGSEQEGGKGPRGLFDELPRERWARIKTNWMTQ